jgi:hypothetical protein
LWANFKRIIELFTKKIVKKLLKIWSWDPGSKIRDPEKTYFGSRIQGSKSTRSRIRIRNTAYDADEKDKTAGMDWQYCEKVKTNTDFFILWELGIGSGYEFGNAGFALKIFSLRSKMKRNVIHFAFISSPRAKKSDPFFCFVFLDALQIFRFSSFLASI